MSNIAAPLRRFMGTRQSVAAFSDTCGHRFSKLPTLDRDCPSRILPEKRVWKLAVQACPTATNLSDPTALWPMLRPMKPSPAFTMMIATAQSLAGAVNTRDQLYLRPITARRSVAARLASGLRLLRDFLRRLIILIALEMEWGLVDTRGPMKRPHGRKTAKSASSFSFTYFDAHKPSPWLNRDGPLFKTVNKTDLNAPKFVAMAKLYARFSYLAKIADDPAAKAKRLAFHLARSRHGILMAPQGPKRIAGRWSTEVRTYFDFMAADIINKSRTRPPPLPPPRTHWPTVTAL